MRKIEIFIFAIVIFFSFATGWMVSDWFNKPPSCPSCEQVNYEQIGILVEKAVKSQAVQPFDVDKIKNVRGFTYAPQSVYQVEICRDTVLLRQVIEQLQPPNPQRGNKKIRK
ncbi:MAG: hypothetical protein H7246_07725 [Phycisphaerae bacterium]|nr:hypothetical protein [Saprospiraceae bacterium]